MVFRKIRGASSFCFLREIPYGAKYEITTSIHGWDEKWVRTDHSCLVSSAIHSRNACPGVYLDVLDASIHHLSVSAKGKIPIISKLRQKGWNRSHGNPQNAQLGLHPTKPRLTSPKSAEVPGTGEAAIQGSRYDQRSSPEKTASRGCRGSRCGRVKLVESRSRSRSSPQVSRTFN
jgi:hypothetical protein